MKAIFLTFDSLNRHWLAPYSGQQIPTPNFDRLAARTVVFDNCYVGSMPCIPARRELHTGRYNFLHRGWGPMEPYDFSMPEHLRYQGISTHLVTDHYHYWEDGGQHYMQRYNTYDFVRGQEGDAWKPLVRTPELPAQLPGRGKTNRFVVQDQKNRQFLREPEDWPMHRTFSGGLEFLDLNAEKDNWLLHIETFDPHEPFFAPANYREKARAYAEEHGIRENCDWPPYGRNGSVEAFGITPEQEELCRLEYAALLAFCDDQLGRLLDAMDQRRLWDDTMLIVNTDHGFLLGEKGLIAKCSMPFYNELARIPLFVWDPRTGVKGERRQSLTQTIDLPTTLLEFFGVQSPPEAAMQGCSLRPVIERDEPVREAGLFGMFGAELHVVTNDGCVGIFPPDLTVPHFSRTLSFGTKMNFRPLDLIAGREQDRAYTFTQGLELLKLPEPQGAPEGRFPTEPLLFDIKNDHAQDYPLKDSALENRLRQIASKLLHETDAPQETWARFALPEPE